MTGTEFTRQLDAHTFSLPDLEGHIQGSFALMSNRSPHNALGGTVLIGVGGNGGRLAVKGRYRRWLGEQGTLDLSVGALRASHSPSGDRQYATSEFAHGITGDVALGWKDWAALTVRADALGSGDRTISGVYGGSTRIPTRNPGTAAVAALAAVLIATYGGTGPDHSLFGCSCSRNSTARRSVLLA